MSAEQFKQALQHLLPTGYAWPRDADSVLMRLLAGIAASFDDLHTLIDQATVEWLPHLTETRLDEWEEATGLPDGCFGNNQSVQARRGRVLARLRGPQGVYSDCSPACLGALEAVCVNLGYQAYARYNTPFRVGRDRAGDRVGQLDGLLHVVVNASSSLFRCGQDRVASRLEIRPPDATQMACYLQKVAPARFELVVTYDA